MAYVVDSLVMSVKSLRLEIGKGNITSGIGIVTCMRVNVHQFPSPNLRRKDLWRVYPRKSVHEETER
jgi:hypothetical protein